MGRQGHPVFAAVFDRMTRVGERGWMGAARDRLLAQATGDVLEVGAGTGANLPHYAAASSVTLAEPDPHMRRRLEPRIAAASVPATLSAAAAEALPFPDASFDTVVCTLVLCSVDDPPRALAEMRRVLRPGGTLLFMEHVRSESARAARWQDRMAPAWRRFGGGCHPNRDTVAAIRAAGFDVERVEPLETGGPLERLTPHVWGSARLV